ncbi:SMP-30/gluconolactonase/LRE family protein [Streptomyces sp. HC307]|uniref:SMP-30/gluconolactonase/LRE family protein n=1 Tax=Streptomyces flavusporus TaxID=3385496 RepID=UPI003916D7DE
MAGPQPVVCWWCCGLSERKPYPRDLLDEQWALIVPVPTGKGGTVDTGSAVIRAPGMREIVNAILSGLSNRRVWAGLDASASDGICLDDEGAVWCAHVPNKRCVRIREGGKVLQTVDLDRGCVSCALGDADGRTLFMTVAGAAKRDRRDTNRPGAGRGHAEPRRPSSVVPRPTLTSNITNSDALTPVFVIV